MNPAHKTTINIMAKSKSFFGLRRGSTKSLTFQVLDGKQITKDRVTEVRNPKTNGQLAQRAIMATIMQAYSAGKSIFDHAFEGVAKGSACQRAFMSENAKILRALVAQEINGGVTNPQARVVAPKSTYPVGFGGMMISKGTYDQKLFTLTDTANKTLISVPQPSTAEETAAEWAQKNGFYAGDLYTFVLFPITSGTPVFEISGEAGPTSKQYPAMFSFIRLRCKDLTAVNQPITELTFADMFIAETRNLSTTWLTLNNVMEEMTFSDIFADGYDELGAIGVIRSRDDEDLRSTSYLHLAGNGNGFGIAATYLLQAWKQGTERVGNSSLILEGGNF